MQKMKRGIVRDVRIVLECQFGGVISRENMDDLMNVVKFAVCCTNDEYCRYTGKNKLGIRD